MSIKSKERFNKIFFWYVSHVSWWFNTSKSILLFNCRQTDSSFSRDTIFVIENHRFRIKQSVWANVTDDIPW